LRRSNGIHLPLRADQGPIRVRTRFSVPARWRHILLSCDLRIKPFEYRRIAPADNAGRCGGVGLAQRGRFWREFSCTLKCPGFKPGWRAERQTVLARPGRPCLTCEIRTLPDQCLAIGRHCTSGGQSARGRRQRRFPGHPRAMSKTFVGLDIRGWPGFNCETCSSRQDVAPGPYARDVPTLAACDLDSSVGALSGTGRRGF
jgi:hypothetical protein